MNDLSLIVDYFSKSQREAMKKYLDDERELYGDEDDEEYEKKQKLKCKNENSQFVQEAPMQAQPMSVPNPPPPPPPMIATTFQQSPLSDNNLNNIQNQPSYFYYDSNNNNGSTATAAAFSDSDSAYLSEEEDEGEGKEFGFFGVKQQAASSSSGYCDLSVATATAPPSQASSSGHHQHSHAAIIDCLLAPAGVAQTKTLAQDVSPPTPIKHLPYLDFQTQLAMDKGFHDPFSDAFASSNNNHALVLARHAASLDIPVNVQSVVDQVLMEDDDELRLLTNPLAVDHIINKIESQVTLHLPLMLFELIFSILRVPT